MRGRQRKPTRRNAGSSATVWATMPSVVPRPRSCNLRMPEIVAGFLCRPAIATYRPRTTMTTTLLMIGVHIGAAKLPREFRMAPISELTP